MKTRHHVPLGVLGAHDRLPLAKLWSLTVALAVAVPARAAEGEGTASDAQPGLHRVGVAEPTEPAIASTVGYGFTEAQDKGDGAHHRLSLRLAGAAAVLPWLNVGPVIDGRYDKHPNDSGGVFEGGLVVRGVATAGDFRLGVELKPWLPGAQDFSTSVKSISLDSRLLMGAKLGNATIAASGGYRLDCGAEAGQSASELGFGDRVALGLSDFDAVLVGIGTGIFFGGTELLAEASGDLLVGSGAPPLSESPLRVTGGVRQSLTKRLAAELLVDVSLSARPELQPTASLVPIEPRVSVLLGIRYRFTSEPERAAPPPPPPPAAIAVAPRKATDAPLEIVLVDEQGAPVPAAKLTVKAAGTTRELTGDASGHYRDEHVPAGAGELSIEVAGFEPLKKPFALEAGKPQKLEIALTALPPPSQIRGVVRSFGGQGLAAKVRVLPLEVETTTDPTGAFQVDVPPGAYEVSVEADGYEIQRRQVRVDPQGVVILNADLVKKGGKK